MQLQERLRSSYSDLGFFTASLYLRLEPHELAVQAHNLEVAHGRILNPLQGRVRPHRDFPAVLPAAPLKKGMRLPGLQARAVRSFAEQMSVVRQWSTGGNRLPVGLTMAAAAGLGIRLAMVGALGAWGAYPVMRLSCIWLQASAWRLVGSGTQPLREDTPRARWQNVRVGSAGYLEEHLLDQADAARAAGKPSTEALWLGAAVGLRLALLVPRMAALSVSAVLFGCLFLECSIHHLLNAAFFYGACFAKRLAGEPAHIVPVAQFAMPIRGPAELDQRAAAALHALGSNVHQPGRTPRTIASLERLLTRYPNPNAAQALMEVRAFILQHERRQQHSPLAGLHSCGAMTKLAAAKAALQGPTAPFKSITAAQLRLPSSGPIPLTSVLATVWQAIALLETPNGETQASLQLRDERREALLLALADCIEEDGRGVCSAGQTQRLLLVLQGFVDCVQIDTLDQVHSPAQFVTEQLQRQFGAYADGPSGAQLLAGLDAAWQQALRTYPDRARRDQVFELLRDYAQVSDDIVWPPPRRAAA